MTSVQANINREDSMTTLNTKQSGEVEALGATSTLPELAGPGSSLKLTVLLRFITEFGLLRDYTCLLEQVYMRADLTALLTFGHVTKTYQIQGDVWVTNTTLSWTLLYL